MITINSLRKSVHKYPSIIIGLCLVLLVVSCTNIEVKRASKFSGEDYINGIFFASGEVAAMIPEISSRFSLEGLVKNEDERIEIDRVRKEMVSLIDKDFLNRFKNEIESGNHFRVQNALLSAAEEIRTITFSENGPLKGLDQQERDLIQIASKEYKGKIYSRDELNEILSSYLQGDEVIQLAHKDFTNSNERETCITTGIYIFSVAAVVAAVAVYVFVAEAVAFYVDVCVRTGDWFFSAIQRSAANSQLFREQLINTITVSFAK